MSILAKSFSTLLFLVAVKAEQEPPGETFNYISSIQQSVHIICILAQILWIQPASPNPFLGQVCLMKSLWMSTGEMGNASLEHYNLQ